MNVNQNMRFLFSQKFYLMWVCQKYLMAIHNSKNIWKYVGVNSLQVENSVKFIIKHFIIPRLLYIKYYVVYILNLQKQREPCFLISEFIIGGNVVDLLGYQIASNPFYPNILTNGTST